MVLSRHPTLSLRSTNPLSYVQTTALSPEKLSAYFDLLEKTLNEKGLLDKPNFIFNMDESGMPLDHKQLKRIATKGSKKVHGQASGNKSQVTIVACASAAGTVLPPMVIFKGERLNHKYIKGEVPGRMSPNGWIDQELFYYWLSDIFLKHIPPQRTVLLLLDGHSTHFTPYAVSLAAKNGVTILCLPPHTAHAAQPLDVSFFGPLKKHWSSACHSVMAENPGRVVTKFSFSSLFSQAWYKAIKLETIVAGFQKVGVCPFNCSAISLPTFDNSTRKTSECEEEGERRGGHDMSVYKYMYMYVCSVFVAYMRHTFRSWSPLSR